MNYQIILTIFGIFGIFGVVGLVAFLLPQKKNTPLNNQESLSLPRINTNTKESVVLHGFKFGFGFGLGVLVLFFLVSIILTFAGLTLTKILFGGI